jgi:Zn-dependent protease
LLFALARPVTFAGLLIAFVLALVLRAVAVRGVARRLRMTYDPVRPRLREDIDPFGAVAAAVAGMGWGKMLSVDDVPRYQGRGRAVMVFIAGPLACIVLAQFFFLAYVLAYPGSFVPGPSTVLHGVRGDFGAQILVSLAVGLLSFGLLELIPIPPLDGFGILYHALRRPGAGMQWMRLWFEEKNIGVVILIVISLFPLGGPFLLGIINILGQPFTNVWG